MKYRAFLQQKVDRWGVGIIAVLFSLAYPQSVRANEVTSSPTSPSYQDHKKELPLQISRYLELIKDKKDTLGPLGKWQNSEIEIILNPEQIQKIQNQTRLRLLAQGYTEEEATKWSNIGIVAEDNYWIWIRDAVIFPSGVYGTYDRLMLRSGLHGVPGVVILPVLSTKKIIVNVNYRVLS